MLTDILAACLSSCDASRVDRSQVTGHRSQVERPQGVLVSRVSWASALALALIGCRIDGPAARPDPAMTPPTAAVKERSNPLAAPPETAGPVVAPVVGKRPGPVTVKAKPKRLETINAPSGGHRVTGRKVKFDGPLQWHDWERGIELAQSAGRPICLVLYADWCARCRELAPIFADPTISGLANDLVMVKHNIDDRTPWLVERFGRLGTYVPRVFFLSSDGALLEEIKSSHPRYPYFYTPRDIEGLKASIERVLSG